MREPRYTHEAYRIDRRGRRHSIRLWTPGIASEFIHHLPELLAEESKPVVLYPRVSTEKQKQAGNFDDQVNDGIGRLREMGFKPGHDLFIFDMDRWEPSSIHADRLVLELAIREAQKRGAILVATHRYRFIRYDGFDGRMKTEAPTIDEYVQLRQMAGDVPLATLFPPDHPAARSDQIRRGQRAKRRKGGRPPKRKNRELIREIPQRELIREISKVWRTLPRDRGERVSGSRPKGRTV